MKINLITDSHNHKLNGHDYILKRTSLKRRTLMMTVDYACESDHHNLVLALSK